MKSRVGKNSRLEKLRVWAMFLSLSSCRGSFAEPLPVDRARPTATTLPSGYERAQARPSPLVRWCSSGGAPLVGRPVLDDRERVYLATSDGYLHAFERDGRYRWSYTVKGTPLGSVSLRRTDGAILLGTTSRYVYAIAQSGRLHWSFRTVSPVWSGLFALNPSTVVFLGLDHRLYALSNTGSAQYRVRAPGIPTVDPVVADHDVVWVGMAEGVARFVAAFRLEKYALPSAVEQVVAVGERAIARAGGHAYLLQPDLEPKDLGQVDYLSENGQHWVLVRGAEAHFFTVGAGDWSQPTQIVKLPARPSAPPTLDQNRLWSPQADGHVAVVSLQGQGRPELIFVNPYPLRSPVLGQSGRRAVVPTESGEFCAVQLE